MEEEKFRSRRHRIAILRETTPGIWARVCESWAEIHSGFVTIRYQPNLFPGMQAVVGSTVYEITAVIDRPGKTRLVELHVEEIRASAVLPDAQRG